MNSDSELDIADAEFLLSYLFASGPAPVCADAADANDDGTVDVADAITILAYLFAGAADLPPPFPDPGLDPTEDDLPLCSVPTR